MPLVEKTVIRFLLETSTNQDKKYNNHHSLRHSLINGWSHSNGSIKKSQRSQTVCKELLREAGKSIVYS